MRLCRVTAYVTVDEDAAPAVVEALLTTIDTFVINRIPVFESDVSCLSDVTVANEDEIRSEMV
jgi:hypothetical protein